MLSHLVEESDMPHNKQAQTASIAKCFSGVKGLHLNVRENLGKVTTLTVITQKHRLKTTQTVQEPDAHCGRGGKARPLSLV